MERCSFCGGELLFQARFCSHCGASREEAARPDERTQISQPHLEEILPTLDPEATFIQDTPTLRSSSELALTTDADAGTKSAPNASRKDEDEEQKSVALSDFGVPLPLAGGSMTPTPHVPVLPGTPQIGSIPTLPKTPQPGSASPTFPAGNASPQPLSPPPGSQLQHELHHSASQIPRHARRAVHATASKTTGGFAMKWVVVLVTTTIVVAGGAIGALAYILTRPQPVISVTSSYMVGKIPAGSNGTRLHIVGNHFSDNSALTFLLDNRRVPDTLHTSSDSKGNLSTTLPIPSGWPRGRHILTAQDAGGSRTKVGVPIEIVAPGEANTPGPLGAPSNDASFKVLTKFQGQYDQGGGPFTGTGTEIVTGHPDPEGGSVCQPEDNGQPHQYRSHTLDTGLPETQTVTYSCSGTYRGGTLKLTETLLSDTVQLTENGALITCHLLTPGTDAQLVGSYTSRGIFSGTITLIGFPRNDFSCTTGPFSSFYFFIYGGEGTWTGTISTS